METNYGKYTAHTHTADEAFFLFHAHCPHQCIVSKFKSFLSRHWLTRFSSMNSKLNRKPGWIHFICLRVAERSLLSSDGFHWLNELGIYLDYTIVDLEHFSLFVSIQTQQTSRTILKYIAMSWRVLLCYFPKIYSHYKQFNWGFTAHKLHTLLVLLRKYFRSYFSRSHSLYVWPMLSSEYESFHRP